MKSFQRPVMWFSVICFPVWLLVQITGTVFATLVLFFGGFFHAACEDVEVLQVGMGEEKGTRSCDQTSPFSETERTGRDWM